MANGSKIKNRTISIISLVCFALGIGILSFVSVHFVSEYITQQELINKRDELLEEKEYQDNLPDDEDYYQVYVKDNYSIYDKEGTLFIFTK